MRIQSMRNLKLLLMDQVLLICDGVVKEAMELYWTKNKAKGGEGRWHFFRRVDPKRTKYPGTSSTITKYTNAKEAVPFIMKFMEWRTVVIAWPRCHNL